MPTTIKNFRCNEKFFKIIKLGGNENDGKSRKCKKQNRLLEALKSRKGKYVVGTVLLSGIGVALPRIFHILAASGVKEIYADVISKYAIPVLEENNIKYEYKEKVQYIINQAKNGMCPMENKYKDEVNIHKIYSEIINTDMKN